MLKGAEKFLEKHYGPNKAVKDYHDTHPARRVVRFGPEEEHYASSEESDHEEPDPEEVRSFTRVDHGAKRYRTTTEQGPQWSTVVRRETYDLRTGELLETLDGDDLRQATKGQLYDTIPDGPRDIKTILFYKHKIHDGQDPDGQDEGAFMGPEEIEATRNDLGNWSDQELPQHLREDVLNTVPAHVRREVRKAHNGLGHPHKTTFLRMMKLANATPVSIKYAKAWECPVCLRKAAPRKPQVGTGMTRPFAFNHTVCIDLKYLKMFNGKRVVALSIIDAGTGWHAAILLKTRRSDHVARKFFSCWVAHYGVPEHLVCDQGGEFLG
jgi:hypothetical protein